MRSKIIVLCAFAGTVFVVQSLRGIEPEDGPAYMTDSHGAAGVCWFLADMKNLDPTYERYYYGGLDWLVEMAEWDGDRCRWLVSTTAPEGHPNHRYIWGGGIVNQLVGGYLTSGHERYRDTALGGARTAMDEAISVVTPYGPGYYWRGLRVGHSHGPGSVGDMLITVYAGLGETAVVPYIEGLLNWLRTQADISTDNEGHTLAMWPEEPGGTAYESGYCYGNAGTLAFLINAANHFPGFSYPDGIDLRFAVNASARWLMSVAVDVPQASGVIWRYMRHDEISNNIGWGSGVAGIGAQFLDAYKLNQTAGDPFADECLDYARKAAATIIYRVNEGDIASGTKLRVGACGGEGGTAHFLLALASTMDSIDPDFAAECRSASATIAELVVESRLRFGERCAWKSSTKFGDEAVNIAFDYGVTGLGKCLYELGTELGRPDLMAVAREAADYVRFITVWDQRGGCKWPQIVPYGPNDNDGDGVIDQWDAFPGSSREAVDSDGDRMGDNFEWFIIDDNGADGLNSFGDILPEDDYDDDGTSNLSEFRLGTDPTSWTDVPVFPPYCVVIAFVMLIGLSWRYRSVGKVEPLA